MACAGLLACEFQQEKLLWPGIAIQIKCAFLRLILTLQCQKTQSANWIAALHAAASSSIDAKLRFACSQMLSHRVQGLALTGVVFVIVIVVLTIIQAAKHDWFVYKGA